MKETTSKINQIETMAFLIIYAIFEYSTHVWSLLSHFTVHVIIIDRVKSTSSDWGRGWGKGLCKELYLAFMQYLPLFVFAPFVLEPNANNAW